MAQNKKLRLKELLSLSFRTFRTKPQRVMLTIFGMSVGIATVLLLISLGYGLQYILIGRLMTTEDSLITMEVTYPTDSNLLIQKSTVEELKNIENVAEVSPIAEFSGEMKQGINSGLLINTLIVEPSYYRLSGILPDIGKLDKNEETDGAILYSQSLAPLGMNLDESSLEKDLDFKISYFDNINNISEEAFSVSPIKIKGIISDNAMAPTAIIPYYLLNNPPPLYQKVLVKAKNTEVLESVRDKFIENGFSVSARIDIVSQAKKITNIITLVLGIFGITALIVSAIGMFNTMIVGFLERIYEVGILKSIGATDQDVKRLFLFESSLMGLMGGLGGIFIGVLIGQLLNLILSFLATRLGGEPIKLFLTPWWFIFITIIFSIFIGFISGWWPARKASVLSPKEAFTRK